jgi:acetyltransferase-like isoleucine patch superfamily enzyme
MKRVLRNIVSRVAVRIYRLGKEYDDKVREINRLERLNQNAVIDATAQIYRDATIENHLNDRNKIRIGKESRILGGLMVFAHGGEIVVGDHVFCGIDCRIWSAKKISIGNRVLISHNVNIHDNISHSLDSALRHDDFLHIFSEGFQRENDLREQEVIIEDDVWIGFNSTIMKGVRIGRGAIIGSNSVITKDVPSFAVVVGNPPRILKYTT